LRRFLADAAMSRHRISFGSGPLHKRQARIAELEEQSRRSALLLSIGNEINSQVDLASILNRLVDHAQTLFKADHAAVLRVGPDKHFVVEAQRNLSADFAPTVEQYAHLHIPTEWDGRSLHVTTSDRYRGNPDELDTMRREGFVNLSVAPLLADEELVGALVLMHDRPYAWTDEDLDMFEQLGHQGGLAIRNARDWSRTTKWAAQLQSIQQLGARLTRLATVGEIGQAICASLDQLIDYHNVPRLPRLRRRCRACGLAGARGSLRARGRRLAAFEGRPRHNRLGRPARRGTEPGQRGPGRTVGDHSGH
jgi:GAF domain-containing protein